MRFILFTNAGASLDAHRVGVQSADGKTVTDLTAALSDAGLAITSMRKFLELGPKGREIADAAVANAIYTRPAELTTLRAPIYDSEKVLCVGMNYVDHCLEQGAPIPIEPTIFNKFPTSLIASGDPLPCPEEVKELDFEVELAIVIGKEGRRIPVEKAMEYVAGFTVAHDVSARDWQLKKNGGQWLLGKAIDGFAPIGPAIVTPDEVGDVHNLRLKCIVNGEVMQDGNTKELVHKTEACVAWISKLITLKPGDLILTGTPPGVGCFRKPVPIWLKVGDVVTVEIEKIGSITNTVVAEGDVAK